MTKEELQVENGNFTRIINPLIDNLIKVPFKGCEVAVALFIIRKTYGFNKKQDEISLSQFEEAVGRSRHTVIKALKNLQLVNIVTLVQKGSMKGDGNIWRINKYIDTWRVVNTVTLVQRRGKPSAIRTPNLVHTVPHTKDIKNNTKDISSDKSQKNNPLNKEIEEVIKAFEQVDPKNKTYYGNKTQRVSAEFLVKEYGTAQILKVIAFLPQVNKKKLYIGQITTPYELKENYVKLSNKLIEMKDESIKNKTKIAFQ